MGLVSSARLVATPRGARWRALAVVLLGSIGLLGLAPACGTAPVHVLLVGGNSTTVDDLAQAKGWLEANGFGGRVHSMALPSAPDLDWPGSAPMATSAEAVAAEVDTILSETGTKRVDLVGVSQGALAIRHYVKYLGGQSKVDGVISYSGVNKGIADNPGLEFLCVLFGLSICDEIMWEGVPGDTPYLQALTGDDMTPGDNVDYFHIYTTSDEPPPEPPVETILLEAGATGTVTNLSVQQACPGPPPRVVHHGGFEPDGVTLDVAMAELLADALNRVLPLTSMCPPQSS